MKVTTLILRVKVDWIKSKVRMKNSKGVLVWSLPTKIHIYSLNSKNRKKIKSNKKKLRQNRKKF